MGSALGIDPTTHRTMSGRSTTVDLVLLCQSSGFTDFWPGADPEVLLGGVIILDRRPPLSSNITLGRFGRGSSPVLATI